MTNPVGGGDEFLVWIGGADDCAEGSCFGGDGEAVDGAAVGFESREQRGAGGCVVVEADEEHV